MAATSTASAVDRDPAYQTWEAERVALILRRDEVDELVSRAGKSDAEETYQRLLAEGWDEEHAQEKADAIEAGNEAALLALKDEARRLRSRLSIIDPQVRLERSNSHAEIFKKEKQPRPPRQGQDEYQRRLFGYLDRIATALERIAGCKSPAPHKSNGRKVRTTP